MSSQPPNLQSTDPNSSLVASDTQEPAPNSPRATKGEVLKALNVVSNWVNNIHSSEDQEERTRVEEAISRVIEDYSLKHQVMLITLAKYRIASIVDLAGFISKLEEHLDGLDLDTLSVAQKIALYRALSEREQQLVEYVTEITNSGFSAKLDGNTRNRDRVLSRLEELEVPTLTPVKRDKVNSLLKKVGNIKDRLLPAEQEVDATT